MALSKIYYSQDVFFILFVISFLLIALLRGVYFKYSRLLVLGVFSKRYANQFLREDNFFTERINIITFVLLVINLGLFFSNIFLVESLKEIAIIIGTIVAYYMFKIAIIKFLSRVFILKELERLIIFFSFLFDKVFSILIFPLLLAIYFFPFDINIILLYISLSFFFLLLLLKVFYFWDIGSNLFGLSKFYIFLYLCTLEFFPLLLLAKAIIY